MIEGWEWDESLFAGAARYYRRGRLPYAPGFAAAIAEELALDGRGRLLDVGCGPGTVTVPLAPWFAEVVGLDPDGGMLAEAARQGVTDARWVRARAEDLPAGLGVFRVVTFAQSFHWVDRARVAATVLGMLEPGGAIVHISDVQDPPPSPVPLPRPLPPYERIGELVRRYLGPDRRAGQGTIAGGRTPGREDLVIAAAGFVAARRVTVPAGRPVERGTDDLVAWTLSLSGSAPHLFGDRLGDFERDLRALLDDAGGRFAEQRRPTDLQFWRKPDR
ncbi:class I SAM-dependent methyltransferase [Actinoplanes sp. NPDC051343]|uniref:class I SAM-dependent methyltransferase n=1 Tax=Actinoplanes sp. NPDC051343 TaxID=3363906 RepID=UPI0037BA8B01